MGEFPGLSPSSTREWLAEGFAAQIRQWSTCQDESCAVLLARLARELTLAVCEGHVCLPLDVSASVEEARRALLTSGVAVEADSGGLAAFPLVIRDDRLYLRSYYDLETRLSQALKTLAVPLETTARLHTTLDTFFPPREGLDWQKAAAALALTRRLTIISGGPGTGKTTTVAAIIACLVELEPDLRIALAAPTGKAAARLREALVNRTRDLPEATRARLPAEAHTIHRLLGATSTRFRHHAGNPLVLDLLVVDEASMLDLALAANLLDALPPHARLVLLGDKDQLAAVEAGAVFADISSGWRFSTGEASRLESLVGIPSEMLAQGNGNPTLPDCVVWLLESHRFRADSGIGSLARAINAGEGAAALDRLRTDPTVCWLEDGEEAPFNAPLSAAETGYGAYLEVLRTLPAPTEKVFAAFERFRVLVAVHEGARGLAAINIHLENFARTALNIAPSVGPFWTGRPVMVLENDPVTKLFNGDIGLCLPDVDGSIKVFFLSPDGVRAVPPARLPRHDTAFALTVHKSQGSEFDEVLLLLPARPVRVLTRELLYTAVTRASRRVIIAGSAAVFEAGCATRNVRFSGLGKRLRE